MGHKPFSELRKTAGYLTQESFGKKIGVGRGVIAKWETGCRYPRTPFIPIVAKALGVSEGEVIAAIEAARVDEP